MTSHKHVTLDDLDTYLAELLASLNPSAITGNYTGPGAGGILPTLPSGGLIDAFNRSDAGDGTLGTSDFGHFPYSYGPGTPAWRIGIARTANKTAAGGAAALVDFGNVNQAFSVDVTGTPAEEVVLQVRVSDDGTEGYQFLLDHTSNNGGGTYVSLTKLDGTVLVGGSSAVLASKDIFDGNPHTIEACANVGDFMVVIDGDATKVYTESPVTIQSGTKCGFNAGGMTTQFDNLNLRSQPLYDVFGYLTAHANDFDHDATYQGGYPHFLRIFGTASAMNRYGNGLETFDSGDVLAGIVTDLGDADVDISYGYGSQYSSGATGVMLRVSADHTTAAVAIDIPDGGTVNVYEGVVNPRATAQAGTVSPLASATEYSANGSIRVKLRGQHLQVFSGKDSGSPLIDVTLSQAASASTRHGISAYGGNYSVLSGLLLLPL